MNANEARPKNFIKLDSKLFKVVSIEHVKPGKGPAYVNLTIKDMDKNNLQKRRFRINEKLESIRVEEIEVTYIYKSNDIFFFLDQEGNEIGVSGEQVPYKRLIIAGMQYKVLYAGEEMMSISLPDELEVEVVSAPAFIHGQSATAQLKKIVTSEGLEIEVPQYVKKGDRLKINSDLEFIRRV